MYLKELLQRFFDLFLVSISYFYALFSVNEARSSILASVSFRDVNN